MIEQSYDFYGKLARIFNSGVSRSVVLAGNISDLFYNGKEYVPLISFLLEKTTASNMLQVVYEINTPIKISKKDKSVIKEWWVNWKLSMSPSKVDTQFFQQQFEGYFTDSIASPAAALEFMRQLCICSRSVNKLPLLIFIGGCDMLLPVEEISKLSDSKLKCISIVQNWFGDPSFVNGADSVCLISESKSLINDKISRMPQIVSVEIDYPDLNNRIHYINEFMQQKNLGWASAEFKTIESFASSTAGLSIYALRQMLIQSSYQSNYASNTTIDQVNDKIEQFIKSQLGEDVVEFKKPKHKLKDIIGNSNLKNFIYKEIIPRVLKGGSGALSGCAVSGSLGCGKTHIFDAVAAELGRPVITLKNLRSQYYGQTDVIFERLRRVIYAIGNLCISIDEADTALGGVGQDVHEIERRLTGKIQAMMSDPELKGKVFWILMTARIHLLSPDIRRPGRAGDLIIPVLNPEGDDRIAFIKWALGGLCQVDMVDYLNRTLSVSYSAASFTALRSHLEAHKLPEMSREYIIELINDLIPADIGFVREYQTLHALLNCTRMSLLPKLDKSYEERRIDWQTRIAQLEAIGIK